MIRGRTPSGSSRADRVLCCSTGTPWRRRNSDQTAHPDPAAAEQGPQQHPGDRERGDSLLKMTFKALRNVSLDPWRIGRIVAAALVTLHIGPYPKPHDTCSNQQLARISSLLVCGASRPRVLAVSRRWCRWHG